MAMKRARDDLSSDTPCTMHRAPTSELTVKSLASQNGWSSDYALATITQGLPKGVHPAFDLRFADLLGVTMSTPAGDAVVMKEEASLESTSCDGKTDSAFGLAGSKIMRLIGSTFGQSSDTTKREDIVQAIEPAFRLASAILIHDEQLGFWHGVQRAGKRVLKARDGRYKIPAFLTKTQLTVHDRKITLDFLQGLGGGVFIVFCNLRAVGQCFMPFARDGEDRRLWYALPRLPHDHRPKYARIALNAAHLLEPCLNWRHLTVTALHRMWFRLAGVLLHELAHAAAGHAFMQSQNRTARAGNIYFRRKLVAEPGWSYTNYAFGGYFEFGKPKDPCLGFSDWPCPALAQAYDSSNASMPRKGPMPPYKVTGNVPAEHLSRFFEASFWAKSCKHRRGTSRTKLQFERCCGIALYDSEGKLAATKDSDLPSRYAKRRRLA
ncbi:hypothetical protein LTR95_004291 [Oleoguttula sp. CCFEE 5521]